MPINIEEVIIKILTNSQQAISDIKAVDRNVEALGKKAVGSAKSIVGMAAAFGGVRGAIDLAVKAVASYIKSIKEAEAAYVEEAKKAGDYYSAGIAAIIELDRVKELAQINDGKRYAESMTWFRKMRAAQITETQERKASVDVTNMALEAFFKLVDAGKNPGNADTFVKNYIANLTKGTDITDMWLVQANDKIEVDKRAVIVSTMFTEEEKKRNQAILDGAAAQAAATAAIEARNAASIAAMAAESEATRKRLSDEQLWRDSQAEWADIAIAKIKEEAQANRDAAVEILNAWSNTMGAIGSLVSNRYQAQIDAAEDGSDKQKELMRKQFNAEKAMAITQSLIATAVGITKAIPNIPLMIFSAASGALQTAAIAATRPPKFATGTPPGGYIVPPGYDNDSYPVMARSGERVEVTPNGGGGGGQTVILQLDGKTLGKAITGLLRDRMALVPAGAIVA